MKTKMMNLIMIAGAMIGLSGSVNAQALIWEVETESIVAAADSAVCSVRVDGHNRAWVLLQSADESKLVRISGNGTTRVWDLPASDAAYSIRLVKGSSILVQAGANVTRVSYRSRIVEGKPVRLWVQSDVVLEDAGEDIRYDEVAEDGDSNALWYFVLNGDAVSKIVLQKMP